MPFQIVRNDIVNMQVDAIVNTANPQPVFGSGTDTAVYEAAGTEQLLAERQSIGVIGEGCSALTKGYNLKARYIIHTVGTSWKGGAAGEEEVLRSCYKSVFAIAKEQQFESLAIPLLASGSYGFPKGIALRIAISEIEGFLAEHEIDLYLVVFDEKSYSLSSEFYGDIDAYISDNYVEEKKKEEYAKPPKPRRLFTGGLRSERRSSRKSEGLPDGAAFSGSVYADRVPTGDEDELADFDMEDTAKIGMGASMSASMPEAFSAAMPSAKQQFLEAAPMAKAGRSLDEVIRNLDKSFMELVFSFADARGLTDVQVQHRANLDRKAFSKLKCGTTKNPSKATALALAIALELSLDDTKDLLSRAGLALSPCSKQDVIVQYFIERGAYDIFEINLALFEHGESILGSQSA